MTRKLKVTAEIEISGESVEAPGEGGGQMMPQIFLLPNQSAQAGIGEGQRTELVPLPSGGEEVELPGAITILARLPGKSLLDEAGLAQAMGTCKKTIHRMIRRNELPTPIKVSNRPMWIVERIFAFWNEQAEKAEQVQRKEMARIERYRT